MRPVDSFLRSVRDAFRPSDETPAWLWIGVAFCISVAIAWVLVRRYRRRQADERAFARFLAERKISGTLVQLITRLANRAVVAPRSVATQIDVFERATALELGGRAPSPTNGDQGTFAAVRALRRALGFERLAGHFALLTTRELVDGQIVEVAGVEATVAEVNEACFSVTAPSQTSFPLGPNGSRVRVTLAHGHEARYETRCALLARQPGESTQKVILGHDEQPTRIQLRKSVRVTVRGPVRLNPVGGIATTASDATGGAQRGDAVPEAVPAPAPGINDGGSKKVGGDGGGGGHANRSDNVDGSGRIYGSGSHRGRARDGQPGHGFAVGSGSHRDSDRDRDNGRRNGDGSGDGSGSASGASKIGDGSLLDISVGGAALDADIHVPVGSLVQLSFELDGIAYRGLLAFVLECRPRGRGMHHWRLQFRNLPQADEQQLATSVARHSAKPLSQDT